MANDKITLKIDGNELDVHKGATLLDAARQAGVEIPVICYHEATSPNGLCRICVVDVDGGRVLAARLRPPSAKPIPKWKRATSESSAVGAPSWRCSTLR